jgi:hypothetical protein
MLIDNISFINRGWLFSFFLQNTGGIADIIAQLCRKSSPTDELAQFRKRTYIEECKNELKKLCLKENKATEQEEEIEKYMDVLKEMGALIIVFDAIEYSAKLEDAIAEAMLKGIKYQIETCEHFFCPDTRSALLLWCTVRSPFNSNRKMHDIFC